METGVEGRGFPKDEKFYYCSFGCDVIYFVYFLTLLSIHFDFVGNYDWIIVTNRLNEVCNGAVVT